MKEQMLKRKAKDESTKEGEPPSKIARIFIYAQQQSVQQGTWRIVPDQLMVYTSYSIEHREKIAGFDLDGTLIKTKSGHVFPINTEDWQLWSREVIPQLRNAYEQGGFKLCIFTNQKGIEVKKVNINEFKKKVQNIVAAIGIPMQVFISIGSLNYRKPYIGMWIELEKRENGDVPIDRSESLFVGDAAGRIKTNVRQKSDHSCADRLFAANLGIKFYTTEHFFLNLSTVEPYQMPKLKPQHLLQQCNNGTNDDQSRFDPPNAKIPGLSKPELLVFVGPPGCGKSMFARQHRDNYTIVSQDELGTWKACLERARKLLMKGQNVIIDNTNRDSETRKRYIDLAAFLDIPCRCLLFECSPAHAIHNNTFRKIINVNDGIEDKAHKHVNDVVVRTYYSAYKEPQLQEGFSEIIRVRFQPQFESDEHRQIYGMYLSERVNN